MIKVKKWVIQFLIPNPRFKSVSIVSLGELANYNLPFFLFALLMIIRLNYEFFCIWQIIWLTFNKTWEVDCCFLIDNLHFFFINWYNLKGDWPLGNSNEKILSKIHIIQSNFSLVVQLHKKDIKMCICFTEPWTSSFFFLNFVFLVKKFNT